jgi:hypothetical protein
MRQVSRVVGLVTAGCLGLAAGPAARAEGLEPLRYNYPGLVVDLGVDLAPPCRSPDRAGSCPNCFSRDDLNDPERKPGQGPRAWWDNGSCRDPSFRLPDLGGALPVSADQLRDRDALLHRLDTLHRWHDAGAFAAHDAHRRRATQLLLTALPGGRNPFDLSREVGRTPRISPIAPGGKNASGEVFTPGRHHWGDAFPCLLAGGIRPGRVVGSTDRDGGLPTTEAFTPSDLAATVFHPMGVGPGAEFRDPEGRPYRVYRGEPIRPLL